MQDEDHQDPCWNLCQKVHLYLEEASVLRMLIWGSIRCALAMKIGGEAKAHGISKTQKWFGEILPSEGDI